ncbi:ATP-binding protein [Umezawaea sp. Da 62-37]|uniref:ATP-binding protein n=1 Tax=Umezawaea sp. Da 62-37 TaxID=3075927 RepID=UPI0028F6E2CA|nr:ATP-binding protein [Umezawaea sp. Da 62-37]WNV87868.1 ATP-binding protein [Umezawaea sp. Da 62-37]
MAESDLKARSWRAVSADTPLVRTVSPAAPRMPGSAAYQPVQGAKGGVLVAMSVTSHHDVAVVRHRLQQVLHRSDRDVVQDVEMVATELLANALEHALAPCGVTVTGYPAPDSTGRSGLGEVVIEVLDGSCELLPVLDRSSTASHRGRGMRLVRALSHSWGILQSGRTKTVWASMRLV